MNNSLRLVFWAPFAVPLILPWLFMILWWRQLSQKFAFLLVSLFAAVGANWIFTALTANAIARYIGRPEMTSPSTALYMGYPLVVWGELAGRILFSTVVVFVVMWSLRSVFRKPTAPAG